jgi:hypothetical protein
MTDSLKARIEEIASATSRDSWGVDVLYPASYEPLKKALLAALEIEQQQDIRIGNKAIFNSGYNQALADVRAKIEGAMG